MLLGLQRLSHGVTPAPQLNAQPAQTATGSMGGTHSAADAAAAWEKLAQGLRMLPPAASCCGAQATLGAGSTSSMDEAARVLFSSGAAGAQTAELLASACLAQLQAELEAVHLPRFWLRLESVNELISDEGGSVAEDAGKQTGAQEGVASEDEDEGGDTDATAARAAARADTLGAALHGALQELGQVVWSHCGKLSSLATALLAGAAGQTLNPTATTTNTTAASAAPTSPMHSGPISLGSGLDAVLPHSGSTGAGTGSTGGLGFSFPTLQPVATSPVAHAPWPPMLPATPATAAPAAAPATGMMSLGSSGVTPGSSGWGGTGAAVVLPAALLASLVEQYREGVAARLQAGARARMSHLLTTYYAAHLAALGWEAGEDEEEGVNGVGAHRVGSRTGNGGEDGEEEEEGDENTEPPGAGPTAMEGLVGGSPRGSGSNSALRVDVGGGRAWGRMGSGGGAWAGSAPHGGGMHGGGMGHAWGGEVADVAALLVVVGLGRAGEEAAAASVAGQLGDVVARMAEGVYDSEVLPRALRYVATAPLAFLRLTVAGAAHATTQITKQAPRLPTTPALLPRGNDNSGGGEAGGEPSGAAGAAGGGSSGGSSAVLLLPSAGLYACLAASDADGASRGVTREWGLRLSYMAAEALGSLRCAHMFDIVVEWPDSLPAVRDVAACLNHTNLHARFVTSFRSALAARLLHAGASARDIVHTYVSTIRVLRAVDPSGKLLGAVAGPVRAYLRARPDTARCIVALVTGCGATPGAEGNEGEEGEEGGGGLSKSLLEEELAVQGGTDSMEVDVLPGVGGTGGTAGGGDEAVLRLMAVQEEEEQRAVAVAAARARTARHTTPDRDHSQRYNSSSTAAVRTPLSPTHPHPHTVTSPNHRGAHALLPPLTPAALLGRGSGGGAGGARVGSGAGGGDDVVGLLMGVFGSRDAFLTEYRSALARELLAVTAPDYDTSRARRTAELLKLRLGEGAMGAVEVMLKDVADSRRTNAAVHARAAAAAAATAPRPTSPPPLARAAGSRAAPGVGSTTANTTTPPRNSSMTAAATVSATATGTAATGTAVNAGGVVAARERLSSLMGAPAPPLSATIMSHLFWPRLGGWGDENEKGVPPDRAAEAALRPPPAIAAALDAYAAHFAALKSPRKLHWKPHLGLVSLEVAVGGVVVEARVSPVAASILCAFEAAPELGARELAAQVGLPLGLTRRRVLFWLAHGVLREERRPTGAAPGSAAGGAASAQAASAGGSVGSSAPGFTSVYVRATRLDPALHGTTITDVGAEDDSLHTATLDAAGGTGGAGALEAIAPYVPYIFGMLHTYGGLPLDRLHSLLKLFVVSPKFDKSVEQLASWLGAQIVAGTVVMEGGVYKKRGAAPVTRSEN